MKLLNPFYIGRILIKYLFLFIILFTIFILPLIFLGNLGPIIEPNYIYGIDNREAISFTLKIISIYIIIVIIYSIIYYNLKISINKIIINKINSIFNIELLKTLKEYKIEIINLDFDLNKNLNLNSNLIFKEEYSINERKEIEALSKEYKILVSKRKKIRKNIFILQLSDLLKKSIINYFIILYITTYIISNIIFITFN